jgi:Concanavalin A-like lectin/glucanases superfamily
MTLHKRQSIRSGSVYVTTLVTVVAVSTTILIGFKLRTLSNDKSSLIENMTESNQSIDNATEYALQVIANDADWNTTAQTGVVIPKMTIDGVVYSGTVKDADTDGRPSESTSNYQITVNSTKDYITNSIQLNLSSSDVNYPKFVDTYFGWNYWPLDESTKSTTASDGIDWLDGTYNDPMIVGTATNDQGARVPLFAANKDHVDVPYSSSFSSKDGSITLWMKSDGATRFQYYGLLGMLYKSSGAPSLSLVIVDNAIGAYVANSNTFDLSQMAASSPVITTGQWHHVAVTWGAKGLFIYVDGAEVAANYANTSCIGSARWNRGGEQPLHIGGGYETGFSSQPYVGFEGSIAHVVYYKNSQLTADEVATIAAVHPDESGLTLIADSWATVYSE